MKILLSAFSCDPSRGSEASNGWNWACELACAGQDVWVLSTAAGRAAIERSLEQTPIPRLQFIYVEPPRLPSFFGQFRLLLQCFGWQKRALKVAKQLDQQVDFDIVHHVTWASMHVGSQMWRLGKPFVFGPVGGGQVAERGFRRHFRGGWLVEATRSFLVRHLTGILFNAKRTVVGSSLVLVTNFETLDWTRRLGARRAVFMLDVGISQSLIIQQSQRYGKESNCLRILWVGRLLPRKAVLLALEALSQIDVRTRFSCTILGDGKQGRYLMRWIEQLGLRDRVVWRGQVPWVEVLEAYLRHDVLLFTSLRDTSASQLIEAMARGAAVVALDHHGARAVVPANAGIKVPVSTPRQTADRLARALERLAREPDTLADMGRNGVQFAAQHTWERKVAQAIALYPCLHDDGKTSNSGAASKSQHE